MSVYRIALAGLLAVLVAGRATAHPAWGIVVADDGSVLFSDVGRNVVWRVDAEGRLDVVVRDRHSHLLHVDQDGTLVGEHVEYDEPRRAWRRAVWRLSPDGVVTDMEAPDDVHAVGVRVGGERIVVETVEGPPREVRIVAWRDGQRRVIAGGEAGDVDGVGTEARFHGINALVPDTDGESVLVTDGAHVRCVSLDGRVVTLARAGMARIPRGPHPRLLGLAVDGADVYVADYDHRQVRRITRDGRVETVLRGGRWWSPAAVAVQDGRLYVVEDRPESLLYLLSLLSGPRLRIVDTNGTVIVAATVWRPGVAIGLVASPALIMVLLWRLAAASCARRPGSRTGGAQQALA